MRRYIQSKNNEEDDDGEDLIEKWPESESLASVGVSDPTNKKSDCDDGDEKAGAARN